jgi:hypothetical protein
MLTNFEKTQKLLKKLKSSFLHCFPDDHLGVNLRHNHGEVEGVAVVSAVLVVRVEVVQEELWNKAWTSEAKDEARR